MMLNNEPRGQWVNGTLGHIATITEDGGDGDDPGDAGQRL